MNLSHIAFSNVIGQGTFYIGSSLVQSPTNISNKELISLSYKSLSYGDHQLGIILFDEFDRSALLNIDLFSFENLIPIANFSVVGIGLIRTIDARANPDMVEPGDVFLNVKTPHDWVYTGIVIKAEGDIIHTEGNTNDEGSWEGFEVCLRRRNFKTKNIRYFQGCLVLCTFEWWNTGNSLKILIVALRITCGIQS